MQKRNRKKIEDITEVKLWKEAEKTIEEKIASYYTNCSRSPLVMFALIGGIQDYIVIEIAKFLRIVKPKRVKKLNEYELNKLKREIIAMYDVDLSNTTYGVLIHLYVWVYYDHLVAKRTVTECLTTSSCFAE